MDTTLHYISALYMVLFRVNGAFKPECGCNSVYIPSMHIKLLYQNTISPKSPTDKLLHDAEVRWIQ